MTPEIPDWHPCVIIRGARGDNEKQHTVTIVPLTSSEPSVVRDDIVKLSSNPNPTDDRPVWALCEFLSVVGLFRLEHYATLNGKPVIPRISNEDLEAILDGVLASQGMLKRRMDSVIESQCKTRGEALEASFEARLEEAVWARLEEMTAPQPEAV